MFAEIEGHEVEAFNAATRTMKCLQIANGAAYVDEKAQSWKEVHDAKIKALENIIEEACGMPVLVAYHFRSDLERLRKAFPKGCVLDKRPETLRDWNSGKIPLLFAHPASAGHGLNLQDGGNILVFFSVNWNLEEHAQIIERICAVGICCGSPWQTLKAKASTSKQARRVNRLSMSGPRNSVRFWNWSGRRVPPAPPPSFFAQRKASATLTKKQAPPRGGTVCGNVLCQGSSQKQL